MTITKQRFLAGCRCLIDNEIEADEVQIIMQALFYVMFDMETEHFMEDAISCCQDCAHLVSQCDTIYGRCNIHTLEHFQRKAL